MPLCGTCGNDFAGSSSCPYCGSISMQPARRRKRSVPIVTINLELGRPTVEDALVRLESELGAARMRGARLVRLIHGYGSSGTGGAIRDAVRSRLKSFRPRRVVPGETFSEDTNAGKNLLRAFPALRETLRTDRDNPGITFLEI